VIECCKKLNARLAPEKAKLKDPTWQQVIVQCFEDGVDLSARYWYVSCREIWSSIWQFWFKYLFTLFL